MSVPRPTAGWPTLLDRVDWPAVSRALADRADPASRDELDGHTEHGRFAVHILTGTTWRDLSALLRAHQTGPWALGILDADRLAEWLHATAHVSLGVLSFLASVGEPVTWNAVPTVPRQDTPGLHVDPELAGLPLLDIARELAEHIGGSRHVTATELPPGTAGRHMPRLRIELDIDQAGEHLHHVWLHELGHALDFLDSRSAEQAEDYAETLADLLEQHEPDTLEQAATLCLQAHESATAREKARATPDLPAPGRESITAFLDLPITVEKSPSEIA